MDHHAIDLQACVGISRWEVERHARSLHICRRDESHVYDFELKHGFFEDFVRFIVGNGFEVRF